ncbi:MAG: 4Fe-4S dicluster domain-containing protein [Anaerolineales bacterium]|nr:4Fe-4S dicluster domain-containing protein [Anaerolineales bacterium]
MLQKSILDLVFITFGLLTALLFLWFSIVSIKEREKRAAAVSAGLGIGISGTLFLAICFTYSVQIVIFYALIVLLAVTLILFLLPIGKLPPDQHSPTQRFDERNIVFARHRLQPGTPQYEQYYTLHPENQLADDRNRARPGILSPYSKHANPAAFAAADASFQITETLGSLVEGEPVDYRLPLTPEEATRYLKAQARHFGASDVGITQLEPYHIYSHIGRGPGEYGGAINLDHSHALAFTVEMDFATMQSAPYSAAVIESAHQYIEAGKIAVQLAAAIRLLGYQARAHIDGSYRVICPAVARDAGLGEIGRISLLMTPELGPRVRLGVVTTNLELVPDSPGADPSVIDFCTICKKCADNCPSGSIPFGPRMEADGILRWKLNPQTCFAYWNEIGTDCGICMAVCPYAHPDNLAHNLVRWGNRRSGFFRRAALRLDDLFYGRKPKRHPNPKWLVSAKKKD